MNATRNTSMASSISRALATSSDDSRMIRNQLPRRTARASFRGLLRMSTLTGFVIVVAGCGSSGVSSASDAESWVHDKFQSDQMEVNGVACEDAPGQRYRCQVRVVTLLGVDVATGWVDCEADCRWRPVRSD